MDFYSELYSSEYTEDKRGFNCLCSGLPRASEETNMEIDGPPVLRRSSHGAAGNEGGGSFPPFIPTG